MGCQLFNHMCSEYPELRSQVQAEVEEAANCIVEMELAYIEKIFEMGDLENLKEADIDSFLDDALRNQDYRLTVRLMYLNIIKSLANKELINWKIDKTNG